MEKLMKMVHKAKKNKGFSLVELIIVIAIMAALVAILAPQYLKYVEKSRESSDQTALDEVIQSVKVAATDTEKLGNTDITLEWEYDSASKTYKPIAAADNSVAKTVQDKVITSMGDAGAFTLKSAKGLKVATYTVTIKASDNSYAVTLAPTIAATFS